MRIIFAGTPPFAATALQAILAEHTVVAVLTQPDRRSGRGKKLIPSPVKQLAQAHDIEVLQPEKLKPIATQLEEYNADVMVVVAYGMLIPQMVLDIPKFGCLNIHASILPRWRGAAPIQRAIEAGDAETGVSIMQMEAGLDTGPVFKTLTTKIERDDTSASLHEKLAELGARGINQVLSDLESNTAGTPTPQDDKLANYAHKLEKAEANIDWSESAVAIAQKIRAFIPWPVCQTFINGQRLRIWQAQALTEASKRKPGDITALEANRIIVQCGNGQLALERVQKDGGKPLDVKAFRNGFELELGQGFDSSAD